MVKSELHNAFCSENELKSFFVSAKDNERVTEMFVRIASSLAGTSCTAADINALTTVLPAHIVDHQKDDPDVVKPHIDYSDSDDLCSII